jgi:membrane associated rhomboid family serine protease
MIRRVESLPPNLFKSRVPKFGSKDWVPRSTAGRVGALILGTVYAVAGLLAVILTPRLKTEFRSSIPSPAVGMVVSFLVIAIVLAIASVIVFWGSRIVVSAFQTAPNRNKGLR